MIRFLLILLVVLLAALAYAIKTIRDLERRLQDERRKAAEAGEPDDFEQRKSIIRHDLKGILNRIFALSRLLPMSGSLNEAQQDYLKKIEEQCNEGGEAINRVFPKNPQA